MMPTPPPAPAPEEAVPGLNGWLEAGLFAIALSVLNVSYGLGHQLGAHPVVFVAYVMIFASLTLLAVTGPGPNWRPIMRHPLSLAIGSGIIAMEAVYFMLLKFASPADGSLLVRLNVPVAALLGYLLAGRRTSPAGLVGHAMVASAIALYIPALDAGSRWIAVALGLGCGVIMTARVFATEFHPWNRAARTVIEKMRLTGLVLLLTSSIGASLVAGALVLRGNGILASAPWLPELHHFLHLPTILLGLFVGAVVLTTMQYLGFSVVLKIQAENFVATTALIPLVTVVFQLGAVAAGILRPIPFAWAVLAPMLGVFSGVLVIIWAGRRAGLSRAPAAQSRA